MAGIKPFVQQAVRGLEHAQLQLLSEALRVDLRGCDERADVERVLTGLLCLDQDSSLGVFLSWWLGLNQQSLGARKDFQTTFVPAISSPGRGPSGGRCSGSNQRVAAAEDRVPEHHLDAEIRVRLAELEELERTFKAAERHVHTGSPSFDKLKAFLVALAQLRSKEEETRRFLLRNASLLRTQHDDMQRETLHTRGQLDFFVAGFTNLRKRHDALLGKAARLAAEHETAHALFVEMSAQDAHWAVLASNTLQKQLGDLQELRDQVAERDAQLDNMRARQEELLRTVSGLKQQRGDARKDAHCFKQQLRVCKDRMRAMEQGAADAKLLRRQASELRQSIATLLSVHLRDAIHRDAKSSKQTLSKEALRIVQRITAVRDEHSEAKDQAGEPTVYTPDTSDALALQPSRKRRLMTGADSSSTSIGERLGMRKPQRDVDEVVKGVVLVGGAEREAEACAKMLAEKLKYLPVDVAAALDRFRLDDQAQSAALRSQETTSTDSSSIATGAMEAPAVPIARYAAQLSALIQSEQAREHKRAFVLYNWSFSGSDVDWLKAAGVPVDSILDLQLQVFQAIAPAEFAEERAAAVVAALECEKSRRLAPVIRWDEDAQRTHEQLAMFGEEVLTLLAIEQENRKPAAKKTLAGSSSSSTSSASTGTATSRGASRGGSRAASPTRDKAKPAPATAAASSARGGRSPTAGAKKAGTKLSASGATARRATEAGVKSPPQSPTRRLTQQGSAPIPSSKSGKLAP